MFQFLIGTVLHAYIHAMLTNNLEEASFQFLIGTVLLKSSIWELNMLLRFNSL